MYIFFTLSY